MIEWTKEELKEMDRKTRKILTIYKCFLPRDDVDRLYWKRVEEGRGWQSVEDVEIEKCSLGHYLNMTEETFLKEVKREKKLGMKKSLSGKREPSQTEGRKGSLKIYIFIYLTSPTRAGSPQQLMPIM